MDAAVDAGYDDGARVAARRACVVHPCAYHELDLPELYGQLGEMLCRLGRFDESLEAYEAAIAAGERSLPHPRTNVAAVLLRAGRRQKGDATFAELRRRCPGDIRLYNAAGFSYAEVGEHAATLQWLDEGIVMALAEAGSEGALGQLASERCSCREALGLGDGELTARVAAFERPRSARGLGLSQREPELLGEAHQGSMSSTCWPGSAASGSTTARYDGSSPLAPGDRAARGPMIAERAFQ
jgi:tetratricopeptide (TPR) repeat protein